jgi:hypothetical protein
MLRKSRPPGQSAAAIVSCSTKEKNQGHLNELKCVLHFFVPTFRLSPVHSLSLAPATSALASTLAPAAPVHRLQQATASGYSTRGPIRSRHSLSSLALAREDVIANALPRSRLPIAGRWQ